MSAPTGTYEALDHVIKELRDTEHDLNEHGAEHPSNTLSELVAILADVRGRVAGVQARLIYL